MGQYNSWQGLSNAIREANNKAMKLVVENSFAIARKNTLSFYDEPEGYPGGLPGHYQRTFMLAKSPQKEYSTAGNLVSGEISLDTDYRYPNTDLNTKQIYNLAEEEDTSREIQGKGHFWAKTKDEVEKELHKTYGKIFSK